MCFCLRFLQLSLTLSFPGHLERQTSHLKNVLGKKKRRRECAGLEVSHPLYLPNACLQQGNNLCFKVAPWGAPVWQTGREHTALKAEGASNEMILESCHKGLNNP